MTNTSSGELYIYIYIYIYIHIYAYILIRNLTKIVSVLECILAVNGTRFVNDELPDCSGLSQDSL